MEKRQVSHFSRTHRARDPSRHPGCLVSNEPTFLAAEQHCGGHSQSSCRSTWFVYQETLNMLATAPPAVFFLGSCIMYNFTSVLQPSWYVLSSLLILFCTLNQRHIDFLPGKRALAIGLCVYHSVCSTVLYNAPRFIPHSFGPLFEQ